MKLLEQDQGWFFGIDFFYGEAEFKKKYLHILFQFEPLTVSLFLILNSQPLLLAKPASKKQYFRKGIENI